MGQLGFFDADKRLSAKAIRLRLISPVVPFESFRAEIEAAVLTPANETNCNADRKLIDVIVMFRMLVAAIVLQSIRRTGRVSSKRMPVVRAVSAARHRG
jgi:hypothetical protein